MALWTVWRNRSAHDGSLLRAYVDLGRVSGTLAQEAERIRTQKLDDGERALLLALFVRLVRLGETGGTTRRVARRDEFRSEVWPTVQRLAEEDYARLLSIFGEAVSRAGVPARARRPSLP